MKVLSKKKKNVWDNIGYLKNLNVSNSCVIVTCCLESQNNVLDVAIFWLTLPGAYNGYCTGNNVGSSIYNAERL